ncbi:hypothetical protein [Streptomyces sp. NPDC101237]|uniref:hypothetical protein n=1 Tax=Streptomyces sp. NPDC101237 TaxID=3366139 RepID=UPI00380A89C7
MPEATLMWSTIVVVLGTLAGVAPAGAIETAWRTAMDLPDIVLGPVTGGPVRARGGGGPGSRAGPLPKRPHALRIAGTACVKAR